MQTSSCLLAAALMVAAVLSAGCDLRQANIGQVPSAAVAIEEEGAGIEQVAGLATPELAVSPADPMAADPLTALNHLRLLEYQDRTEEVLAYLATPAAREFVLRRSRQATRDNIRGIQEGRYGFAVLAGKASGDAGLTILQVVDIQASEPVKIVPFYLWRIDGIWHFLPNPTVVNTWYQQVPAELSDDYFTLARWYEQQLAVLKQTVGPHAGQEPRALLAQWAAEMAELGAAQPGQ